MSNAARNKGVSEKHISEWQNQLENAEREWDLTFSAYSVLTSAYNWWTLIPIHELFIWYLKLLEIVFNNDFVKKTGLLY